MERWKKLARVLCDLRDCMPNNKRFSSSVQYLLWHHAGESPAHERTALARPHQLADWHCIQELQEIAIEKWITHFAEDCRRGCTPQLSANSIERLQILLKTGERTKQPQPAPIATKSLAMSMHITREQPTRRPALTTPAVEHRRNKLT